MREGRWIIIEDIDLAPMDVLSVLVPLLETRQLFIPGRGQAIQAAMGFQLFATQPIRRPTSTTTTTTTSDGSNNNNTDSNSNSRLPLHLSASVGGNAVLLSNLWTRVLIEPLSAEELVEVVKAKYPEMSYLASQFVGK